MWNLLVWLTNHRYLFNDEASEDFILGIRHLTFNLIFFFFLCYLYLLHGFLNIRNQNDLFALFRTTCFKYLYGIFWKYKHSSTYKTKCMTIFLILTEAEIDFIVMWSFVKDVVIKQFNIFLRRIRHWYTTNIGVLKISVLIFFFEINWLFQNEYFIFNNFMFNFFHKYKGLKFLESN